VMFQQAFFATLSPKNSEKTYFSFITTFHIPGGWPPSVWFRLGLSGEDWPATSLPGRGTASTASRPRSIATRTCSSNQFPSHSEVFLIFTSIWWDPFSMVVVLSLFSLSLTAHPNGWKQFPYLIRPQQHALSFNFFLDFLLWSTRNDHF
jgi:hypothetical protein